MALSDQIWHLCRGKTQLEPFKAKPGLDKSKIGWQGRKQNAPCADGASARLQIWVPCLIDSLQFGSFPNSHNPGHPFPHEVT
jgi:hypothetical protein